MSRSYRSGKPSGSRRRSSSGSEARTRLPRRASTVRAVLLVAVAALLQAVAAPYLTFGFVAPAFAMLCIVVAAAGLKEPSALLVGFFGGTLVDALGSGFFGVGALSGVLAAAISVRAGVLHTGTSPRRRLAVVTAAAVAVHDLINIAALGLAGNEWPPAAGFALAGLLPDAALNGLLAYAVGGILLRGVLVEVRR